jgi:hypothetical protein
MYILGTGKWANQNGDNSAAGFDPTFGLGSSSSDTPVGWGVLASSENPAPTSSTDVPYLVAAPTDYSTGNWLTTLESDLGYQPATATDYAIFNQENAANIQHNQQLDNASSGGGSGVISGIIGGVTKFATAALGTRSSNQAAMGAYQGGYKASTQSGGKQPPAPQKSNALLYVALGTIGVGLIVGVILITTRKK